MSAGRARSIPLAAAALGALAGCGVWALLPLKPPHELAQSPVPPPGPTAPSAQPGPPLDLAVFRAPLWLAPPPPSKPVAAQPPPPPPPVRLQLIGIVLEERASKAVLYDPDTDELRIAAPGQRIGRCTVETVTLAGVMLRDGGSVRMLALRDDRKDTGGAP